MIAAGLAAAAVSGCAEEAAVASGPTPGSNERAYYDDGCRAGTQDAQSSMSMFHGRHADQYDTRFEPSFQQGCEACWLQNR
jgi:hypothetical protein